MTEIFIQRIISELKEKYKMLWKHRKWRVFLSWRIHAGFMEKVAFGLLWDFPLLWERHMAL